MCGSSVLADKLLGSCFDFASQKVVYHVTYIFGYKKKMKELENEKKKLEKKIRKNEEKVEGANTLGEIVEENVKEWANMAENMKHEVEEFIDASVGDINTKCFKFSCPNLISRYRISKQAEQKIGDLKEHIMNGDFNKVSHRAPHPAELQYTSSGDYVYFNSRKSLMNMINDSLVSPAVNMIGVYGAGGIGKTAVVEEVGKNARKNGLFDEVVVAVVSQDVNVLRIQGLIAVHLNLKLESETEEERAGQIWNRLSNGKNNLVILDDLWEQLDLKAIGIPLRKGNEGCKVILTTRNHDVLRKMRAEECIAVEVLSKDESWALFEKKVRVTFASAELRSLAEFVCKECGGLPVAILAVGGALAGKKEKHEWNDALDQLRNSSWESIGGIDRKIFTSLRVSFYYLEKDAQEAKPILLLCCLYPEDDNIPVDFLLFHCIARRMLDPNKNTVEKARDRIFTLIDSLKARSLLLDGENKDFVKMHDVVRDVGLSIAKRDEQFLFKDVVNEWPDEIINENLFAASIRLNKLKDLPNELVCPRLHTLRIECSGSSFQFPDNFFSGVRELKILEMKGINMVCSPSSLANLSELGALILIDCQLEDMSFLKGLKSNLKVLVILHSSIKALPTELGEVSGLRVLLLNDSDELELIPAGVISKLTHLEELCLPYGFSLFRDVDSRGATFSELSSLTRLTRLSFFIPDIEMVPDLDFEKLVSYEIAVRKPFYRYDRYEYRRNKLKLVGITYDDKLGSLLARAESLHLERVEGLKNDVLSERVGGGNWFLELEALYISRCHDLDCLPGNPNSSFNKLTYLKVNDCGRLKFVFTSSSIAKGLQQLQYLYIRDCQMLEEILRTEDEKDEHDDDHLFFSKLTELRVYNCRRLKFVFTSSIAKGLQQLQYLHIRDCDTLEEIVGTEDEKDEHDDDHHLFFSKLTELGVYGCRRLKFVFTSSAIAKGLQQLQELYIHGCEMLEEIVGTKDEKDDGMFFSKLRHLSLCNLPKLRSFWGGKVEIVERGGVSLRNKPQPLFNEKVIFPALEILYTSDLPMITEIWDKQVLPTNLFPRLDTMNVEHCDELVNVFPSNLWVENLKNVTVRRCKGVKVIVSSLGVEESEAPNKDSIIFHRLQKVDLSNLENLITFCGNSSGSEPQSLFDPQVQFPTLNMITLRHVPSIDTFLPQLFKGEIKFPAIQSLDIDDKEWYTDGKPNIKYFGQLLLE